MLLYSEMRSTALTGRKHQLAPRIHEAVTGQEEPIVSRWQLHKKSRPPCCKHHLVRLTGRQK